MAGRARTRNAIFWIRDAVDMKDAMLIYGRVEIRGLEKSLQDPKEGDVYVKLRIKLNNYFSPLKMYIMRDTYF